MKSSNEKNFCPIPAHIKEIDVGAKKEIAKHIKKQEKRLIVVLESANLETVKVILIRPLPCQIM